MSDTQTMAMLEKRRIEATILKHVYDTLKASHGIEAARRPSLTPCGIGHGAGWTIGCRRRRQDIDRDLHRPPGAVEARRRWPSRSKEQTDTRYRYNVTRCKYAEMYRDMGLGEIGHLLSCQRDGTFCEGYDERISSKRTQTIMQGASHCDFDYTFEKNDDSASAA